MSDRIKVAAVVAFILLPVIAIAVLKYTPALNRIKKVSAISILPTRIVGDFQPAQDLSAILNEALSGIEGIRIQPSPSPAQIADAGKDMQKLADAVGADALVVTVLTADAGIVQLDVQLVDPASGRVLYNNPYHSPRDQYPQMVRAAGTALRHALAR
jgi:hypothetical protein